MSSEKKKPTIHPMPDGPYMVEGLVNFANRKGVVEPKEKMALCRCGGSKNKPYCDGSHMGNGFSSAKLDGRMSDQRDNYEGNEATIHDNRSICAHAGRCTEGLPNVFRPKQEPWIDPSAASGDEIAATVRQCPSGAISYSIEGKEHRDGDGEPIIFIAPNGPYVVTGGAELLDTDWAEGASTEHFTLCRCGASKNKPFCDGSHWQAKFTDDNN